MEGEIQQEYSTSDVVEASYLKAKGFGLTGTNKVQRIVYFVFEGEDVKEMARKWQLNPSPEMKLVRDSHTEREELYKLIRSGAGHDY